MTPEDEEFNRIEMESKVRQEHITQSGWRKRLTQEQSRYCLNCETLSKQVADLEDRIQTIYKQLDEQERAKQEQGEPVAVKHMMEWADYLKRKSDYGQHMQIPSEMSAGACWELAVELEQFINTTPQQHTWVGLTSEDYNEIFEKARTGEHAVQLAETRLKENNTTP